MILKTIMGFLMMILKTIMSFFLSEKKDPDEEKIKHVRNAVKTATKGTNKELNEQYIRARRRNSFHKLGLIFIFVPMTISFNGCSSFRGETLIIDSSEYQHRIISPVTGEEGVFVPQKVYNTYVESVATLEAKQKYKRNWMGCKRR